MVGVILLLFSSQAQTVAPAFLLGWMAGLAMVGAMVQAIAGGIDASSQGTTSTVGASVLVLLGLLPLLLAYRRWQGRPSPGEEANLPKWMASLDTLTLLTALGLGALLSAVNPKNWLPSHRQPVGCRFHSCAGRLSRAGKRQHRRAGPLLYHALANDERQTGGEQPEDGELEN
jgi:hypothetical protein